MKRRSRTLAAWFALVALLFAQLAVAAYACPRLTAPEAVASMPDCDEPMNANLCESHCEYGSMSHDSAKAKVAPAAVLGAATWLVVSAPAIFDQRPAAPPGLATGPPVTRFTVLRI